jgi:hypothetical protein
MTANEIQNMAASATTDESTTTAATSAIGGAAVQSADAATAASGQDSDRLSLEVLSREPVLHFTEATDSGGLRTVTAAAAETSSLPPPTADTPAPPDTGITTGATLRIAERPALRVEPGQDGGPGHTELLNPKTGEIVARVSSNDFFGLDAAIRAFVHQSLVDKSA